MATNTRRCTVLDLDQGRLYAWRVDATSEQSLELLRSTLVTIEEPKARHFQSCLDSGPGLDAQESYAYPALGSWSQGINQLASLSNGRHEAMLFLTNTTLRSRVVSAPRLAAESAQIDGD